jgi:diaminohydroxyphosphoribosylaminopyrimidine deaminase/5-amino-6-(5-phosphoribosylamino)uracil reductase
LIDPFAPFDRQCMARALQLARLGWYSARPNPRVGCVIARDGRVVGEGYHHRAGEPHAEVNALAAAGPRARGATAYVTLEPCNHQGRTGPCSRALIDAGVAEVVYAMADPHPIAGGGLDTLRAAGIRVRGPLLEAEARALNPGFIKRCGTGLPRVTVKLAMSLDGRTAMASGESQWITGPAARRDVQRLRAASDAVVTGVGTVLRDDPSLNVRAEALGLPDAEDIARHQPLRVIVDSGLRTPPSARLLQLPGPVLIAAARTDPAVDFSAAANRPEILPFAASGGRVDLAALFRELARRDCGEVLVEAGAELAGALVAAGLVDQLVVYMAPKLMGSNARPLLTLPLDAMGQSIGLAITEICAVGEDWRITAQPAR